MSKLNQANSSNVFYVIALGVMDEGDAFDQPIPIN